MRLIFLVFFLIPSVLISQSDLIHTRKSYHLKGKVKYYEKEYLKRPKKVRGFVKVDSIEIESYVDIPRVLKVIFNKQGYVINKKGIRFSGNGGNWERIYEYLKFGDTLNFRVIKNNYGQDITYDYEFHFSNGEIIYQYEKQKNNFETSIDTKTKITHNTLDSKNRLIRKSSFETTKYQNGKIDTVSNSVDHGYVKDKLWSYQYYYRGKPSYRYYYPFDGIEKYFTRIDTIYHEKDKLDKIIKTVIANEIKIVTTHNYREDNTSKVITRYNKQGGQISETRFRNNAVNDGTFTSASKEITTYDDDTYSIKSNVIYNIDLETSELGERLYYNSYDKKGKLVRYITPEILFGNPSANREYEYVRNNEGYIIKIFKKEYIDGVLKVIETTDYNYDKHHNLIYEKTLDTNAKIISEIRYVIEYYEN